MSELLHVSSAPHVRAKTSTSNVMLWVIIALLPTTCFGIYNVGINDISYSVKAVILLAATVLSCVLSETVYNLIAKKKNTIGDLSAVVTGMILALNMPVTLPIWQAVLGGVFAIIIVKMLFGGLGQNFMNPALAARCFLLISFGAMNDFEVPDLYVGSTPLAVMKESGYVTKVLTPDFLKDLFVGTTAGTIGETSAICLLIGALILVVTKTISLRIPLAYLGSFAVFMFLFGQAAFNPLYVLAQLLAGGVLFGAFFMATDYATTPITRRGQILFGICCGLLTGVFRCFGASPEGVSYAIVFCNLLVPLIEKVTIPKAFGIKKKEVK